MTDSTALDPIPSNHAHQPPTRDQLRQAETLELAQVLAEKLSIQPQDWHRLSSNRQVRASEQTVVALVYLLKNQPEEALTRLQQASGWLDRSISAPPCPTHGERAKKRKQESSASS